MKFEVLKDAFVENRYRVKGTIVDLPDKYLSEPTVFRPVDELPKPDAPNQPTSEPTGIPTEPPVEVPPMDGPEPGEPPVYISKADRKKLNLPPED